MATSAVKIRKRGGTPQWVFVWREVEPPVIPRLIALGFGITLFGFLIGAARIQVMTPAKTSTRKASLIYLRDDAEGRAWSLRAKEGGPFPSRFEPAQWQGLAELETGAMEAVRYQPRPYVTEMKDLPRANELESLGLAAKGEVFLPRREGTAVLAPDLIQLKPAPMIYALSGISPTAIPTDLPPFTSPVDTEMSAFSWRFLLKLDAAGTVSECVSLARGGVAGSTSLESWLSQISFPPAQDGKSRWIAVSVAFINQPIDGTEAR
jgi:hypothetical protein